MGFGAVGFLRGCTIVACSLSLDSRACNSTPLNPECHTMAMEIERKFLVSSNQWKASVVHESDFRQGYLANGENSSIRVRIGERSAELNIKSLTQGVRRQEYEYTIPLEDAEEILDHLCTKPLIEKTRYYVEHGGKLWEIDQFNGANEGLVVAEIELASEDEMFDKPDWVGEEVTHDLRYNNVCLVTHPFKDW